MNTFVLIEDGKVVGTTTFKKLEGYKVLPAPENWDGNLERLKYENGKLSFISEEDYVRLKKEKLKTERKQEISKFTEDYIANTLSKLDEDLADITSEAQVIEGRILYIAAKEGITVTTDEVKQKVALFVAGAYTQEQAISDLQKKGLSEKAIQSILPLLARAVEIAKILNWKEEIWNKETELETQIDSMTLEELEKLDAKKLCDDAYSGISLEV
jgi:hypothetical protein